MFRLWAKIWKENHLVKDICENSSIEKVISIIDADINVGTKKWRMKQLPVYRYLLHTYYPRIRKGY